MRERLVITGMGAVTPVGVGVPAYWDGLVAGKCGIADADCPGAEGLTVPRAALVRDFHPRDFLPTRLCMDLDDFMQYAFVSAEEALAQSGLDAANGRTGVVMGTALAGINLTGRTQEDCAVKNGHVSPRFLSKIMGNMAAAQFAILHRCTGPSLTLQTACASGGDAILTSSLLLRAGMADAIVVLAGEAAFGPLLVESLVRAGALSKTGQSRPFDKARDGFVVGEGGGAIILETETHAKARGANILAELLGASCNSDAHHPVSPEPEGLGAAACMRLALRDAGLQPGDVGYLNAHGTATPAGDAAEIKAVRAVFGEHVPFISSTKGATGHMMGAGGITELIACVKAIETGMLPPTLGLDDPDEGAGLPLIAKTTVKRRVSIAMSNVLGFGGQNSCLIAGAYHG
jgi:3-oxoacyl-[acyl-carrier-protein] synthase II